MIDGFRYGFYGFSSVSVWVSLLLLSAFSVALILVNLFVMKRGTGLKS